ncbi:DedA family protein [soil metagenome]
MEFFTKLFHLLFGGLGDDAKWNDMIQFIGGPGTLYVILFAIVFCETGLVILPFLPGDSLLFAIGAMVARKVGISLPIVSGLLVLAALVGDNVNYWIGRRIGPKIFSHGGQDTATPTEPGGQLNYASGERRQKRLSDRLLNRDHLDRAQKFYVKYGRKTVILARFVPIIRTFAPFVAGIGAMPYLTFLTFSLIGALLWVNLCLTAGFLLGNLEFFKKHFELVILIIVIISVVPMGIEFLKHRSEKKKLEVAGKAE